MRKICWSNSFDHSNGKKIRVNKSSKRKQNCLQKSTMSRATYTKDTHKQQENTKET